MSRKLSVPAVAEPLVDAIRQAKVFTRPTFPRFICLMGALILTMGRHTVSRALKVMGPLQEGHWSNYHRVYSQARYCMWELAAVVVRQLLPLLPADAPIVLVADDTVDAKEADHVWAKGTHRDPVRSSRKKSQVKFGGPQRDPSRWGPSQVAGDVRAGATAGHRAAVGPAGPVRAVSQPEGGRAGEAPAQDAGPAGPVPARRD